MSNICSKCGASFDSLFCPNCGTQAQQPYNQSSQQMSSQQPYNSPYPQNQFRTYPNTQQSQKKHGCLFWGLIISGIIIVLFIFSIIFVACMKTISDNSNKSTTTLSHGSVETTIVPSAAPLKDLTFNIGDTIKTDDMEVTINKIEFSYDVKPDDTNSFYTHYPAEEGNVYIHIDTDVKNLSKQGLECDDILTVIADYNDGYKYDGNPVVEDASLGFTYANITSIDPLKTLGVHFLISCPEEVEESDNPLFLTFKLSGTNDIYKYTIR